MVGVGKKFTKESKVREIQKNLHKRAKLKRQYLKTLEQEGYEVPEEQKRQKPSFEQRKGEKKQKVDEKKEHARRRKREQKEEMEAKRQRELDELERAKVRQVERERRNKRIQQKTRSGQPKMGPRINDLLDKIQKDTTYTS
ncbi:ABR226Wp [Eremothecium gossypii ATCC 10895]|uniref:rRNA-processing protein FYV7 n=1 Tax=Eremothecium gossypii (strain ATCC 10895 / CBS 109.51 / FGSC 9923 / NRRL Y-1056) TaxID=284811 RepID=FYV7_EREGS|nr:ABR226Wp [Eremothecium gossypii ATCC 10895]Q75CZ6.1 RecName: Full=rRNA-processing protein FYV7 [Eremothecium gossypii ATCC 10895]AAS50999.1 ABR226Wp [Eremothecium gossypii ATCC 10895]